MKPAPRRYLPILLLLLAPALPGCKRGPDRQIVYPARKGTRVFVGPNDEVRVHAPGVDVHVPPGPAMDPANGVDVPMIEPD